MPRFVLLLHECATGVPRPTHCDLMLESGDTLETWALAELPWDWRLLSSDAPLLKFVSTNTCTAERLTDHRLAYLDYEGPVSGDRGTVQQLDAGTYSAGNNPRALELAGQLIRGQIELRQSPEANAWQLTFTPAPS